jgi:hypothetical protein
LRVSARALAWQRARARAVVRAVVRAARPGAVDFHALFALPARSKMLLEWFKACQCRPRAPAAGFNLERPRPAETLLLTQKVPAAAAPPLPPPLPPSRSLPSRARARADKVEDEALGPEAGGIWLGARLEDGRPAAGGADAAASLRAAAVPASETARVIGAAGPGKKPICVVDVVDSELAAAVLRSGGKARRPARRLDRVYWALEA